MMEQIGMLWAQGGDARPGQQAVLPSALLTSGTHTIALNELSLPVPQEETGRHPFPLLKVSDDFVWAC